MNGWKDISAPDAGLRNGVDSPTNPSTLGAVIFHSDSGERWTPSHPEIEINPVDMESPGISATGAAVGRADSTDLTNEAPPPVSGRPAKVHKCTRAQDGHSHIEDVLYGVLRRAGRPEEGPSQNVITQAGSTLLCKETRVHKRNLGTVLRGLVFKKSIEILDYEKSSTRTARRYRVFSYSEILKKRREAGLEWVVRRRGVEFVNPATGEPLFIDPGATDGPEPASPDAVTAPSLAVTAAVTPAFTTGESNAVTPRDPHAVTASPLGNEAGKALRE